MGLNRPRIVQFRCILVPVCRYEIKEEENQ